MLMLLVAVAMRVQIMVVRVARLRVLCVLPRMNSVVHHLNSNIAKGEKQVGSKHHKRCRLMKLAVVFTCLAHHGLLFVKH